MNATYRYHEKLKGILQYGSKREDRTGTGTYSVFGGAEHYDMREGFPLITTKKVNFKAVIGELVWFIKGETDLASLRAYTHGEEFRDDESKKTIWDEFAGSNGTIGEKMYGGSWRNWGKYGKDQLKDVIEEIKKNPTSRRLVVTAYDPEYSPTPSKSPSENVDIGNSALDPCHMFFQFYCSGENYEYLSLQFYMRSADMFLGVPFNISSYSALLHVVAHLTGKKPLGMMHLFGDTHIYQNHVDAVNVQLSRDPFKYSNPKLRINPDLKDINDVKVSDFILDDYEHFPYIKADVSV